MNGGGRGSCSRYISPKLFDMPGETKEISEKKKEISEKMKLKCRWHLHVHDWPATIIVQNFRFARVCTFVPIDM